MSTQSPITGRESLLPGRVDGVRQSSTNPVPRLGKRLVPVLVSGLLIGWLVARISPTALVNATKLLNWPVLVALTSAMVLALYIWDTVCLRWLFSDPDKQPAFAAFLHA